MKAGHEIACGRTTFATAASWAIPSVRPQRAGLRTARPPAGLPVDCGPGAMPSAIVCPAAPRHWSFRRSHFNHSGIHQDSAHDRITLVQILREPRCDTELCLRKLLSCRELSQFPANSQRLICELSATDTNLSCDTHDH